MSFWGRPSGPTSNTPKIRVEKIAVKTKTVPKITPRNDPKQTHSRPISTANSTRESNTSKSGQAQQLKPPKKSNNRKRSPVFQRVESDSSDDDDDSTLEDLPNKRQRVAEHVDIDVHRQLRAQRLFSDLDNKSLTHAADIASRKLHFGPAFTPSEDEDPTVYLQYPGGSIQER